MLPISLPLDQIKIGMIAADDVISPSGQLVIPKNTVINPRNLSKLRLYNVKSMYVLISDELANEMNQAAPVDDTNPIRKSEEFKVFQETYTDMTSSLNETFEALISQPTAKIDYSPVISQIDALFDTVKGVLHLMGIMQCMRDSDDTVYTHSISVAMISRTVASHLKLSEQEMKDLMLSCILHDIGKTQIPKEVLYKSSRLTDEEFELIKRHPSIGYDMLRNNANLSKDILCGVLLHHERWDGSGYPSALTGDKIPLFARIIAIADVYDAMTARRAYRKEICPFDVIASFENDRQKFDLALLIPFLRDIAQSCINATVRLSNTLTGTVVMLNEHKLSRPVVNVNGSFIDLSQEKRLSIVSVL